MIFIKRVFQLLVRLEKCFQKLLSCQIAFLHRECPEECREAVASLIYAAARFSDLPELRDLRDAFHQRYGVCLEAFVNQKVVSLNIL